MSELRYQIRNRYNDNITAYAGDCGGLVRNASNKEDQGGYNGPWTAKTDLKDVLKVLALRYPAEAESKAWNVWEIVPPSAVTRIIGKCHYTPPSDGKVEITY